MKWISEAVTLIWDDLTGRHGIQQALEECDEGIQQEIRDAMAEIIDNYLSEIEPPTQEPIDET